jgi:ankyrin repeat protein
LSDLHCAVRSETWDAVPALMRFPRADARVALHLTAASGQTRLVQSILRRFAREDSEETASEKENENETRDLARVDAAGAAVAAAARGHHSVLAALLDAGLDADAVDERGVHVLTAAAGAGGPAAARGHHSVLAALLDAGLDADAVDERGVHVLTAAAGGGREDAERDEAGETAFESRETTTRRSCRACVAALLAAGADADAGTSRLGWKPLMAAAKAGDVAIVDMLIDAGARVDQTYHNGKTPLYCAAEWGRLDAARALLRRGADVTVAADRLHTDHAATSRRGITPYDVARANGHGTLAEVLRRAAEE